MNMKQRDYDLNIRLTLGRGKFSVADSLYELVTNAMDANRNAENAPSELNMNGNTITVQDSGEGMEPSNFTLGPDESRIRWHGYNGIGLKDAVATLMREGAEISIGSCKGDYSFDVREGGTGADTIHLIQRPRPRPVERGTTIEIKNISKAADAYSNVKGRFLKFCNLDRIGEYRDVEVYSSIKPVRFVFVNGVKKKVTRLLKNVYNFKNPTEAQKKLISRDHAIDKGFTNKRSEFLKPMKAALESLGAAEEDFNEVAIKDEPIHNAKIASTVKSNVLIKDWDNTSERNFLMQGLSKKKKYAKVTFAKGNFAYNYTVAYSLSKDSKDERKRKILEALRHSGKLSKLPKSCIEREWCEKLRFNADEKQSDELGEEAVSCSSDPPNQQFERDLVHSLLDALQTKNHPMFSLSSAENYSISSTSQQLVEKLKSLSSLSVAEIKYQGSMPKHTVIPGFVDVDIVVRMNYVETKDLHGPSDTIKRELPKVLPGVQFMVSSPEILQCVYKGIDFDIVLDSQVDKSFEDGIESVTDLRSSVGADKDYVLDAIRACKYWIKRHSLVSPPMKSYQVENLVLEKAKELKASGSEIEKKRCLFEQFLTHLCGGSDFEGNPYEEFSHLARRALKEN